MTLPEKCVQIPSKASVELNTTTTTNASWSFLSSIRRATLVLLATGGYILAHHTTISPAKCLMDTTEGDINKESLKPLEMNEVAALTHTSLLRQASAVAVDSALQLLHRTLRASVDFSAQYRKQLNEVIDLMEFCTVTLSNAGQHDSMWELLVAARAHADSLQQQLRLHRVLSAYLNPAWTVIDYWTYDTGP
ncbi:hypothetical protein Pmani_034724 [Petrolisthes manimaculis]|uniref:Direct IAP-binding protein with low pI n=1 Tax=Petrolisthes manimaculis TaxID=1843537 RepID=A0AAE1NNT5_9EUCA|nr:hypothetical protein Pmani_034724 [Petrolisthes manimaculis]